MAPFDFETAVRRAEARLGEKAGSRPRRPRSDRGRSRLPEAVVGAVYELLQGWHRPALRVLLAQLSERCRELGQPCPSRATVYNLMARAPCPRYGANELPECVREALYNQSSDAIIPGQQVAFYCFNYGDARAMSVAAGMPWLCLYQAARLRGFRPKSRGALEAVLRVRNI